MENLLEMFWIYQMGVELLRFQEEIVLFYGNW